MFWNNKEHKPSGRAQRTSAPSVITADMHILGNIVSDGMIDLAGTVNGNVNCQLITIRENGKVKGEITAEEVYVYGKVEGLIKSSHAHLYNSCHIEGIVMHESLTIEDGAFIDGKCKRTNKPASETSDEDGSADAAPKIMENIRLIR